MAKVPLTGGRIALVDDADLPAVLAAGRWRPVADGLTTYARTNTGRHTWVSLHTFLTGWSMVDHRNGDGLDNRRANLRPATKAENAANSRKQRGRTSPYKGVTWHKQRGRWQVQITVSGRTIYLGLFDDPAEGARAYDAAAREHFGAFARPNFPEVSA
jgi:hypothetical protein